MPRKKSPTYRLEVVAPVNGRVHKADIKAFDAEGNLKYTDRANLTEVVESRKAAERMAKKLKLRSAATVEADLDQAWRHTVEEQRRKHEEEQAAAITMDSPASDKPSGPYLIEHGRVCRRRFGKDGEVFTEPLCNFVARIDAETTYDDGGETQHCFRIAGRLADGDPLAAVDVPASDFAAMNWTLKNWGVRAIVSPGQGAKDHLRAAIQEMSRDAQRQTIYRQTGWRQIGSE